MEPLKKYKCHNSDLLHLTHINIHGRMAEWSKALVLGTSHFGGAGSNPVPVIIFISLFKNVEIQR